MDNQLHAFCPLKYLKAKHGFWIQTILIHSFAIYLTKCTTLHSVVHQTRYAFLCKKTTSAPYLCSIFCSKTLTKIYPAHKGKFPYSAWLADPLQVSYSSVPYSQSFWNTLVPRQRKCRNSGWLRKGLLKWPMHHSLTFQWVRGSHVPKPPVSRQDCVKVSLRKAENKVGGHSGVYHSTRGITVMIGDEKKK